MTNWGKLTFNGKTYNMQGSPTPVTLTSAMAVGNGNLTVNSGPHAGTYNNVTVYKYKNVYWVWPSEQFSAYAITPKTVILPPVNKGAPSTVNVALVVTGVAIATGIVAILGFRAYARKNKGRNHKGRLFDREIP